MAGYNNGKLSKETYLELRVIKILGNLASEELHPPVSETSHRTIETPSSAQRKPESFHPAITFHRDQFVLPNKNPSTYLALDLKTPRLNAIHQYLWLAGPPNAARPLHKQKLIGRNISITEDPDEHLVWSEDHIFIKPLPDYLFDYGYWNDNLRSDKDLHESACGLLLSYAWLIRYKSDISIAKETGLVSKNIEWTDWVEFLERFLDNIDVSTLDQVNKRYQYGELRLSRLNTIYRLIPPTYSLRNFIRGYMHRSTWYSAFFERNFKWMLAIFAIFSVFLSALQVGLATPMLQDNELFQRASYGFTLVSLIAISASVALVFIVLLVLFWYHLLSTWHYNRAVYHKRRNGMSLE
jgi:hypothetical protein